MKILLLGKNGQVGWELQRALAPLGEVVALDSTAPSRCAATSRDPTRSPRRCARCGRDAIVNAAAYTAVDKAESEPELAAHDQRDGRRRARARGAPSSAPGWCTISTDYVFDGSGDAPCARTTPTGPLSVYGRTKLEGEERDPRQRLPAPDPAHELGLRRARRQLRQDDAAARARARAAARHRRPDRRADRRRPARRRHRACAARARSGARSCAGTYHVAAAGETSWHGYARFVIEQARGARRGRSRSAPDAIDADADAAPTRRRAGGRRIRGSTRASCAAAFGLALPPWQAGVRAHARRSDSTLNGIR